MTHSPSPWRRRVLFLIKVTFSLLMLAWIVRKLSQRDGFADLGSHLATLSWPWFVGAIAMQLVAIAWSIARWRLLLGGQGIRAPWSFLANSFMIGRFWGAFTPGGFTGLGGWRIYDIAKHSGQTARATAVVGIEMVLGQLAMGVVVMLASMYGARFLGSSGVLLINLGFAGVILLTLTFLSKPALLRMIAARLPLSVQARLGALVDAFCAYQGKTKTLLYAALCGVGVHSFNNLIYVCAARALHVELGVGEVFFASSLQILSTLIPLSINGVGLREATAVALYTRLGIPAAVAVLIPLVGFTAEMLVSAVGGLLFLLRRSSFKPRIEVEPLQNTQPQVALSPVALADLPLPIYAALWGAWGGAIGGMVVGLAEAVVVQLSALGTWSARVFAYGALSYGIIGTVMGLGLAIALALSARVWPRPAMPAVKALLRYAACTALLIATGLAAFRLRRDLFHEAFAWKSIPGLALLAGVALTALLLYVAWVYLVDRLASRSRSAQRLGIWSMATSFSLLLVAMLSVLIVAAVTDKNSSQSTSAQKPTVADAGPILVIVVDTLRADHLPAYGYTQNSTPHLDAFTRDAIRFDQAFANASWTRPSFASILTGRFAASHNTMSKNARLNEDLPTLAEQFQKHGWETAGFVTNYNVAPYFNFDQGFDHYRYLEPDFVLGADDLSAKLLSMQFIRQRIEGWRAWRGKVQRGSAYQDAQRVNTQVVQWLDQRRSDKPWFLFLGYMDPHDPYYEHPYNGKAYARAAHQHPKPEEAETLKKLYDGEIAYWDSQFGTLIKALKQRGLYDKSTILVTSDHGEEFADHGGFWHGTTLYDEQLHVPLWLKLPQAQRGGTVLRHWVQSIDIMPSLLRLSKLSVPKGVQGGDLFTGHNVVYAEEDHEGNRLEALRERGMAHDHKLITANPNNPRGLPTLQSFNVDTDPEELVDLAPTQGKQVRESMARMIQIQSQAKSGAVQRETVDVEHNRDAVDRLKALGYVEE